MTASEMPAGEELVAVLAQRLTSSGWRMVSVESCTGGAIGSLITDRAGSSDWYEGGWITYSNALKVQLGVPAIDIDRHGAVSEQVARAMAEQGRLRAEVDIAVSVTGVAGPAGGSPGKPVGMVWIAWAWPGGAEAEVFYFDGDRSAVREQATLQALHGLQQRL
ncbi:CinA family protein [Saccharospirillum impatiens]|uniref:CinA family protein n=1 Tax=Saccharospirillum impatiens TaxID=169438 RepID=UPI00040AD898|nr:CinA family protein [Saccharospirillum impatiens]